MSFGGTGHLTMNDRLMASRIRESLGKSACIFSGTSLRPWLFLSRQSHGGHGEIRGSFVAPDPKRPGQSRQFCRQAVSSPLRRVPPNHQVETNRCQASRLRSRPVIGDSFPVCHGALTAAVAHLKRSVTLAHRRVSGSIPAMKKSMKREFTMIVERDEEGYYVGSVPELRGCHTQARSLDRLVTRVREAISLCLEVKDESRQCNEFVGVQRIAV